MARQYRRECDQVGHPYGVFIANLIIGFHVGLLVLCAVLQLMSSWGR